MSCGLRCWRFAVEKASGRVLGGRKMTAGIGLWLCLRLLAQQKRMRLPRLAADGAPLASTPRGHWAVRRDYELTTPHLPSVYP